jgi:hypothetical protein
MDTVSTMKPAGAASTHASSTASPDAVLLPPVPHAITARNSTIYAKDILFTYDIEIYS